MVTEENGNLPNTNVPVRINCCYDDGLIEISTTHHLNIYTFSTYTHNEYSISLTEGSATYNYMRDELVLLCFLLVCRVIEYNAHSLVVTIVRVVEFIIILISSTVDVNMVNTIAPDRC